jgi:hypothetical protein
MSLLIDTITLTGSLAEVREALVIALRTKGFPIRDDASLCEIVDTINRGEVDYCGFVRCCVCGDTVYFPDRIEITLDTRKECHVYDAFMVSDKAFAAGFDIHAMRGDSQVVVQDRSSSRKQTKIYYGYLESLGPCVDACLVTVVHHITDGKVYIRAPREPDIIVRDTVRWQVYHSEQIPLGTFDENDPLVAIVDTDDDGVGDAAIRIETLLREGS